MKWHTIDLATLEKYYKTDRIAGLTSDQAQAQLLTHGHNQLPPTHVPTIFGTFIEQFRSPLIYVLLIAATIIFIFGDDTLDAFIITGVLFFNAILGTIQEERTRVILENLKKLMQPTAIIVRDGIRIIIDIHLLVPGDLLILQEGQRMPADARIIESNNMQLDESMLTGESGVVLKDTHTLAQDTPLGDQTNMVFKGTYLVAGSGKAIVVATGIHTQMGALYISLEDIKTDIPLKQELERLTYWILIGILIMCVALFIVGFCIGKPLKELLIMLTALFICVVPEGLPMVLTLVLASGAYRMAKKNILVKNMQAVEALGRTNIIIIDKTGTLTRNEMMVSSVIVDHNVYKVTGQGYYSTGTIEQPDTITSHESHLLSLLGTAAALLNSSQIFYDNQSHLFSIEGDPTEAALFILSQKMGLTLEKLEKEYTKLYEIPFTSQQQYHAGFFSHGTDLYCFVIGAPEKIFTTLTPPLRTHYSQSYTDMLNEGLRVIAIGYKKIEAYTPIADDSTAQEKYNFFSQLITMDIQLLGLCGLEDAIRPEVMGMIEQARTAGLHIVMATGDHQKTALYVAKKVGLWQQGDQCIDGKQFETLSDQQLLSNLYTTTVYSRITPQHKTKLVTLFHHDNKIVAMTGDGINDVPSLLAADLGIAMGNIGTEIAKQAADLVLLDDSFNNIIHAIEQGRHIFYTLKRVVLYFFATNVAEILIVLFALAWEGLYATSPIPLPLTAAQILWLNLVTDGFLDVGISMEPEEPALLKAQWLQKKQHLIDSNMVLKMIFMAIPMGVISLALYIHYLPYDVAYARTMTLITMAMLQWFNAWNCRSMSQSLLKQGIFSNPWLVLAASIVLALQMLLLYTPFMQHIFKTVPLGLNDWLIVIAVSFPIIIIEEVRKMITRAFFNRA